LNKDYLKGGEAIAKEQDKNANDALEVALTNNES